MGATRAVWLTLGRRDNEHARDFSEDRSPVSNERQMDPQGDAASCALASIQKVLSLRYGMTVLESEVKGAIRPPNRRELKAPPHGNTIANMKKGLNGIAPEPWVAVKVQGKHARTTVERLVSEHAPIPAAGFRHIVVLMGIKDGRVSYLDPEDGLEYRAPLAEVAHQLMWLFRPAGGNAPVSLEDAFVR